MPLLIAQLGMIVVSLAVMASVFVGTRVGTGDSTHDALLAGSRYACDGLAIIGYAWLANRLAGWRRVGARIAMIAVAAQLVMQVLWLASVVYAIETQDSLPMTSWRIETLAMSMTAVAAGIGLGMAGRRWWWIAIGAMLAFIATPAWFVAEWLYGAGGAALLVWSVLALAQGAIFVVISACAARDAEPIDEAAPIDRALGRTRRGLYALAFSTAALAVVAVALGNTHVRMLHADLVLVATIATALLLASLVWLAFGGLLAIRGRGELPAWLVVTGAAFVLAAAGNLVARIMILLQQWHQEASVSPHGMGIVFPGVDNRIVPRTSTQVLAALAIGAWLVAVAIAARRRGLEDLRARVLIRVGALAVLVLGAITALQVVSDLDELTPLESSIIVFGHAALVTAWLLAARTVRRAAGELGAQNLPTAKVVS